MDEAIDAYNRSLDWLGVGGHPRNDARAFQLNERAVALGDPDAILAKGWFHLNGRGVERDLSLAELWYRRSAWRGEPKHVHVQREKMLCKFWLEPIHLAKNGGFAPKELNAIRTLVERNLPKILEAWYEHCG